ncbi:LysM peptidoglycan-binding domain-containing protein [bacterium]|nr:LysM peptidoglycan-binding domain-containing protein [bacterium]
MRTYFPILVVVLFFTLSCSSLKSPSGNKSPSSVRSNDAIAQMLDRERDTENLNVPTGRSPSKAQEIENLKLAEVIRGEEPNTESLYDNSRYDFPILVNSRVEGWIDYFTGKGRGHMERYLERSSRYLPRMKEIFKKSGLPADLVYLALIESGFNLRAKSRAKAVGPWQFMKATGKRYGLKVDSWVDERRDPILSTEAAAAYLKDLYLMFESWYLAASAYNAGEYKILRAIEELKTNNYWRISETNHIRRETKDYIPKLIAAAIIAKNPHKHGFRELSYHEPLEFDTIETAQSISLRELARAIDCSEDEMLDLNPAFVKGNTPPNKETYILRVPIGSKVLAERKIASNSLSRVSSAPKISRSLSSSPSRIPADDGSGFVYHMVKKGESLWSISEQYNVTVQSIFRWNSLKKSRIFPGNKLKIQLSAKTNS